MKLSSASAFNFGKAKMQSSGEVFTSLPNDKILDVTKLKTTKFKCC